MRSPLLLVVGCCLGRLLVCLTGLLCPLFPAAYAEITGGARSSLARPTSSTDSARGWLAIAQSPMDTVSPEFLILGQSLRLNHDLPAIVRYYQQRPIHDYTVRWIQKNICRDDYPRRGKILLELGQLQYGGYAPVMLPIETIRWNENPFSNLNWPWYHHQLMGVHFLIANSESDHPTALEVAKELVRSWSKLNYVMSFPSPLSWNDHSTAYRLRTLLCLFELARKEQLVDSQFLGHLLRMIDSHCRVLADEAFFKRHTNHGFDQATILFWAASAFPELAGAETWLQLSLNRLSEEIAFMFTPEGIHVENSPNYQVWMLGALEELLLMSEQMRKLDLEWLLNDGWKYAAYALQPNGRFPLLGDTESLDFSSLRHSRLFPGCQQWNYAATDGRIGIRPLSTDQVFPLTGYAFFRDHWHDVGRSNNTIYLGFKCSFLSNYHRHDDDLQVVLFAFGEEWLIDSGLYGYEENDPIRRHMRSVLAHNTVVLPGIPVIREVTQLPAPGSRIVDYGIEKSRSFVAGRSLMHHGYAIERRLEYLKPEDIVIHDSISSLTNKAPVRTPFNVLFHLPQDKHITINPDGPIIVSSTNRHRLTLAASPAPCRITVVSGPGEDHDRRVSWVSRAITKLEPSQCLCLEFQETSTATCRLTLTRGDAANQGAGTP